MHPSKTDRMMASHSSALVPKPWFQEVLYIRSWVTWSISFSLDSYLTLAFYPISLLLSLVAPSLDPYRVLDLAPGAHGRGGSRDHCYTVKGLSQAENDFHFK